MCHSTIPATWSSASRAERVVEVAPLAVEDVRVGVPSTKSLTRFVKPAVVEDRDRVLLGVGVQVAEDQNVRVADAGRVGGEPVTGDGGVGAHGVAVALAVAGVRGVACAALALQVVDVDDEAGPVDFLERLRKRRPVSRCRIAGVDERKGVERARLANRQERARAIEHAHLDGVGAEGVDLSRRCRRRRMRMCLATDVVESVDEELERAVRAVAVVFHFDHANDVGASPTMAATVFGHCRSSSARFSAPRQSIEAPPKPGPRAADERVEEIQQVHADDA